jgi:hypothetical protein
VIKYDRFPLLASLSKGIIKTTKPAKYQGRQIIKMRTFTAEQIESWIQISPFCLQGLITTQDMECWIAHLYADSLLSSDAFPKSQLPHLQHSVDHWRELYKFSLCIEYIPPKPKTQQSTVNTADQIDNDSAAMKKKKREERKQLKKREEEQNKSRSGPTRPRQMAKSDPLFLLKSSRLEGGFTANYPNFETENHWKRLIKRIGPVWFQSASYWETLHRQQKKIKRRTNGKNIERDVLYEANCKEGHLLGSYTLSLQEETAARNLDMVPTGPKVFKYWKGGRLQWKDEIVSILRESLHNQELAAIVRSSSRYEQCQGFHLGSRTVQLGSFVIIRQTFPSASSRFPVQFQYYPPSLLHRQPPPPLPLSQLREDDQLGCRHLLASIEAVIIIGRDQPTAWMQVKILTNPQYDNSINCLAYNSRQTVTVWLPLGWGKYKVCRMVHVVRNSKTPSLLYYNWWLRRELFAFP